MKCPMLNNRRVWLAAFVISAVAALQLAGADRYISLETLRAHRQELIALVQNHFALSALTYIGLYIAAAALLLPGTVFLTLSAGFLFGPLMGTLLTVTGATAGATVVSVFAGVLLGENALERFGKGGVQLSQNIKRNAWAYLLVLRLAPMFPFFLVNLVPAFTGARLSTFVLTTFFGIIPGASLFSLSGASLGGVLDQPGAISLTSVFTPGILAALTGLALLSLLTIPLRRYLGGAKPGA